MNSPIGPADFAQKKTEQKHDRNSFGNVSINFKHFVA
jgi:hypothetical protein